MRVELRRGGHTYPADVDLEEEVRRARLFASDEVLHPPWTGRAYRRLGEIPELDEAFDAPEARFSAWVRARHFPVVTLIATAIVALAGVAQLGWVWLPEGVGSVLQSAVLTGALGYEPLLLDGRWWTPWTSQILHAGPFHLAMNLLVLAYCGHRVERALGAGGVAVVGAAGVLGGSALVAAFGILPVVGASILAYGVWGAQIVIGFRVGAALPRGWRGFYGWGNLWVFLPLFLAGLGAEGVSHLGHLGGLLGGGLAAAIVPAESFASRASLPRRRALNLLLAGILAVMPGVASGVLARVPAALAWPEVVIEAREAGVTLGLPWRMAGASHTYGGLRAWAHSPHGGDPIFCDLGYLREPLAPTSAALVDAWADVLRAAVEEIEPPPALGACWRAHRFAVRDPVSGERLGSVTEHQLLRGIALLRVGYFVSEGSGAAREALYTRALAGIQVGEPPALAEARRKRGLYPEQPEIAYAFAEQLARAGEGPAADAVWDELEARTDGWQAEALRGRLREWRTQEGCDALSTEPRSEAVP